VTGPLPEDADTVTGATGAASVRAMLEARRVAIVGASERPGSFGHRLVTEVTRSSGPVETFLVNPRYDRVLGRRCGATLDAIEGPVDLVLLGVPNGAVEGELRRAARRGDRLRRRLRQPVRLGPRGHRRVACRVAAIAGGAGMALCGGAAWGS
jgi:acyl-CoA synthetase (NDP forming)